MIKTVIWYAIHARLAIHFLSHPTKVYFSILTPDSPIVPSWPLWVSRTLFSMCATRRMEWLVVEWTWKQTRTSQTNGMKTDDWNRLGQRFHLLRGPKTKRVVPVLENDIRLSATPQRLRVAKETHNIGIFDGSVANFGSCKVEVAGGFRANDNNMGHVRLWCNAVDFSGELASNQFKTIWVETVVS